MLKPHGFQALNNKPNPNTKLDFFIESQRVDLNKNLWSSHTSEPSGVLDVLYKGYKVAELQVKPLPQIGVALGQRKPNNKQCGALIAMEGGRILNREPYALLEDGLCTEKHLESTPDSFYQGWRGHGFHANAAGLRSMAKYIYDGLVILSDEVC